MHASGNKMDRTSWLLVIFGVIVAIVVVTGVRSTLAPSTSAAYSARNTVESSAPISDLSTPKIGPPPGVPLPAKVGVATNVVDILSINEQASTFTAVVDLRQRWFDPRLAFEGNHEGIDRHEFVGVDAKAQLEQIWTPGVCIANLAGDIGRSEASLFIFSDGRVQLTQRVLATFTASLDFERFPFDRQSLPIVLNSTVFNDRKVALIHETTDQLFTRFRPGLEINNWNLRDVCFGSAGTFRGLNGDVFATVTSQIRVYRKPFNYLPGLFVPFFVIVSLPLVAIWLKTDVSNRLNWVITALFALVALSYSVSVQYPAIGTDSTIMQLFWIGYSLQWSVLMLCLTLFNDALAPKICSDQERGAMVRYSMWSVPTLTFIAISYVILSVAI